MFLPENFQVEDIFDLSRIRSRGTMHASGALVAGAAGESANGDEGFKLEAALAEENRKFERLAASRLFFVR